jgi:hypothetical protein
MANPDDPTTRHRQLRKLAVDLGDLALAMENNSSEAAYYFDLETGEVILVTEDTRREHKQLVAALGEMDAAKRAEAFEAALAATDVHDWERDMLRDAERVKAGSRKRYIRVPPAESHDGYAEMETFIETVEDMRFRDRLGRAIQGKGAFRRFKDTLLDAPAERERWFAFRKARQSESAAEWLRSKGFEPGG